MIALAGVLPAVGLLPEWILHTESFRILATFVALNSVMYATLAVFKVLPKGYGFARLARFNERNRRTTNRSIYPDQTPPDLAGTDGRAATTHDVTGAGRARSHRPA